VLRVPGTDSLCLWLAHSAVERNHPRRPIYSTLEGGLGADQILVVYGDERAFSAFERLTADGIRGCPVLDGADLYVDQIDLLDLLVFICDKFALSQHTAPNSLASQCQRIRPLS
jgi:hypothetical protein